jgi:hypothetical protein
MNGHTLLPESRTEAGSRFWRYLLLIIATKVILEMFFYVGVVRQYGEEDLFVSLALPQIEPGATYWNSIAHFRDVADWAKWTGDPSDMYPFRVAALYPNILFMKMFGACETSLMLWSALTGISAVLVVALIGRSLAGSAAGLFSATVLALIPGHIIYSARVDTDMPQLFFMSLGTFFLVLTLKAATNRKQLALAAICGVSFGLLYLAKLLPAFVALPWALLVPFLLAALGDRETLLGPASKLRQAMAVSLMLLGGFALVFAVENAAYHSLTGHWFLHWKVMKCNAVNMDSWRSAQFLELGFIKLWVPPGGWDDVLAHTRMFWDSLFPEGRFYSVYSAPIHGWSAVLFLPALLVLPFLRANQRKLSLLLVLGFVFYYLYQEFFWLYPTVEGGKLNLTFVHKVHRFIFPCYLGIALGVGLVLGSLTDFGRQHPQRWLRRIFQAAPVCLVLAFGAANYPSTEFYHTVLRSSLADFRHVCRDLRDIAPDGARIFIAAGSDPYYRLFQYPRHYQWKYFVDDPLENIGDGWGVVGGFEGIGASPETFAEGYPTWLRPCYLGKAKPPSGWKLVRALPSPKDPNSPNVRIFKLPELSHQATQ